MRGAVLHGRMMQDAQRNGFARSDGAPFITMEIGVPTLTMGEYRAVTTLVPQIALATVATLLVGTFATNNNVTGNINKPIYLCVLALAALITTTSLGHERSTRFGMAVALLASCGLVWGIWTIERPQLLHDGVWEGFGYYVAIAAAALSVLLGIFLRPQWFSRPVRIGLGLIVAICCVCDLLGAIRTTDFIPYVSNNLNEINDVLGPVAGKVPDSTYIPQYTALYGWLFLPFKPFLSPVALVGAISLFFTLLDFATVGLAVRLVRRVLSIKGYVLPAALVVPITYVTSQHLDSSSIAGLFQELPIRLLSGFLIITAGLTDLLVVYRGRVRPRRMLLIGVLCGLISWNSQDFGLTATVVYGAMILFGATPSVRRRALGVWLMGLIIGVASYPFALLVIGSPLNLSFVATFVRLFGSGLGSAPMQVPGPVLVVMPIIVCSAATGWALMRSRHRKGVTNNPVLDQATITLTFVGSWSALCLAYYVNRAYADGQLQTMLLPCAVCVASLLSIAIHTDEVRLLWERKLDQTRARVSGTVMLMPVGIVVCLCFSSALLTPNPVLAARTLLKPSPTSGYLNYNLPAIISAIHAAQRYTERQSGRLTYLGESFNYVSLETNVPSYEVLFPLPPDELAGVVAQIDCHYIEEHPSRWIVLSIYGLAVFGSSACDEYQSVTLSGLVHGQLQELK
jgi:hypothetical protein